MTWEKVENRYNEKNNVIFCFSSRLKLSEGNSLTTFSDNLSLQKEDTSGNFQLNVDCNLAEPFTYQSRNQLNLPFEISGLYLNF